MTSSTGAYALNIIVTENVWYGHSFGYVPAFLLTLTTLMLGYSFAGIAREVLIYPAEMIWPSTLVSVTLCRTLHEKEGFTDTMTRAKLYWILVGCGFVYYMLPGYIMPILSFVPVLCLIAPNNIYANQIGDAVNGLGFLNLSFNWSIISSGYFGSPMATPWPMACNIFVGFVILIWVAVPAGYYSNVWGSGNLPIYSSGIFKENGTAYDVLRIISSDGMFDAEKYAEYGHINLPFQFGVAYGISFISIAVLIVYTLLNNGKAIYEKIRYVDYSGDDIHARLMRKYDEVPMWWYLALFVVILAISIGACEGYKILPWYWLLAAIGLAVVFLIPIGIVQAISNTQPGLNVITQLIIGYGRPGDQLANVAFKVYGYISIYQGLSLISNQKLGHYMKIPPRHVFIVQIVGTIVCAVIQPGVVTWMLSSFKDICTPAGAPWTCTSTNAFYSASIVWGLVGPRRIFGPDSHYSLLVYCFLIGVLLPIPVWYLQKRYPLSLWKHVHLHVMFAGLMQLPPAPITALTSWFFFCTVFNGIIRRYRYGWWQKYAFVTSAALDTSVTIGFLFVYVCFYVTKTNMPFYWGTDTQRCPLAANGGFKNYKDFLPSQQ
ncbi:hypothetical protein H4R99_003775 [Coemansia sp. RSA 1722]|nr:hypothetical protein H4R99_003775 [Coemansia sp. RSA 1722]